MLNPRCQGADPGHVRRQVSERQGPASRRRGDAGGWDTSADTQGGSGRRPARAALGEPAAGAASPAGRCGPCSARRLLTAAWTSPAEPTKRRV